MIEAAIVLIGEARALALSLLYGAAPAPRRSVRNAYIVFCALYCLVWSLVGGAVMYAIELYGGTPRPYVDTLFTIASAASSTGLTTLDTSTLRLGSNIVIAVTMLCCANTLLISAVPALFRLCRLRAARARCDGCGETDADASGAAETGAERTMLRERRAMRREAPYKQSSCQSGAFCRVERAAQACV